MEKITILIADDHTLVRETWSFILNTDPRFSVVAESGSGEEAVELAKKLRPNVVIMDINLPGINGIEAARKLREWEETRNVPVIALSAAALMSDRQRKEAAIFYRYLTKPVKVDELIGTLEEVLGPTQISQS